VGSHDEQPTCLEPCSRDDDTKRPLGRRGLGTIGTI